MRKNLFYCSIALLNALLIHSITVAEDQHLQSGFGEQKISEPDDFHAIAGKDTNVAISIHHTASTIHSGNYFLSLDLGRLKREAGREVIFKNAYENPTAPNVVTVFKMVLDEFTYFKGLKRLFDSVETEIEKYRTRYKLKGEVGFEKQHHIETFDSIGKHSENSFWYLFPKQMSWHLSSDFSSNYLQGEINLGNNFIIEGSWGSDSGLKFMFTFPL